MNRLPIHFRAILSTARLACAGFLGVALISSATARTPLSRGLVVTEYPRTEKQTSENKAHIPLEEFGAPIGDPVVAASLSPWHHTSNRNALARGLLRIEADGDYAFTTDSFYDRNLLMIGGKVICEYADGGDRIVTVPLKKGLVEILSAGFIGGRGTGQGIDVRWRPPGQRELSPIPGKLLLHHHQHDVKKASSQTLLANYLTLVAKDFVLDVYHNGERVPDEQRGLLLDRFGASAERVNIEVREGDWLVFHVAHNRLRHGGSKFFAAAGMLDSNEFGFVSDLESKRWSVCDDPADAADFIASRHSGLERPTTPIETVWEEGMGFMREYAGPDFNGGPLWGEAPATWIKFNAGETTPPAPVVEPLPAPEVTPAPTPPVQANLALLETRRWPVQILSATYGTGGKDADVTARVKQLVEVERVFFAANPGHLLVDPNPYWNKSLHIVYMKDGVRREQWHNENGHVLPESFYGPQDAAELGSWLVDTRWIGPTGEIQFQKEGAITGPGVKPGAKWKPVENNRRLRFAWSENEKTDFQFDHLWSRFGDPEYPRADYLIVR